MKFFHFILGVVILNMNGLYAQAKTLLILGDSLSAAYQMDEQAGWVALLENKLRQENKEWQVVNASIAGDTTSNALQRLPFLLKTHKPDAIIVEIGANDGLQAKPFAYIQKNIANIITLIQDQQAQVFLIKAPLTANFDATYSQSFSEIYLNLAQQYKIKLIPFIDSAHIGDKDYIQADGLHPNAKAQPLILENIWKNMEAYFSAPSSQKTN